MLMLTRRARFFLQLPSLARYSCGIFFYLPPSSKPKFSPAPWFVLRLDFGHACACVQPLRVRERETWDGDDKGARIPFYLAEKEKTDSWNKNENQNDIEVNMNVIYTLLHAYNMILLINELKKKYEKVRYPVMQLHLQMFFKNNIEKKNNNADMRGA